MRKLLAGSLLTAVAVMGLPFTTPPAQAASSIDGTLVAISGTTLPAVLTVQSGVTSYTVNVTTSTSLIRKYNATSGLDEFAVADLVRVWGTFNGTTVDATKVKDLSIQRKGAAQWGKIVSIDTSASTFLFDTNRKKTPNQTVTTSASTKIVLGNQLGIFADLKVGMVVKVVSLWRPSQQTMLAERIMVRLTELEGVVKTVSCDTNTLTVQGQGESSSLSNSSKGIWTLTLTDKSVLRDRELKQITCADIKVNHKVHVRGFRTAAKALNVVSLRDKGSKRTMKKWEGRIASIDATAKTFVLNGSFKVTTNTNSEVTSITFVTTPETIFVNEEGAQIAFSDLVVGHKVEARGTLNGTTVTVNLVMDKSLPAD